MKFISWNIDSLNAALTSDSERAVLSRDVLATIIKCDPEIIALQETKLASTGPTKKHLEILKMVLFLRLFLFHQYLLPVYLLAQSLILLLLYHIFLVIQNL